MSTMRYTYHLLTSTMEIMQEMRQRLILPKKDVGQRIHQMRKIVLGDVGNKKALFVDLDAEQSFRKQLGERHKEVFVHGEESIGLDLFSFDKKIHALVDMIDGTDLLEMDVPLWCSAAVLFEPAIPRIIMAVVGLANGDMYYAVDGEDGAFVTRAEEISTEEKCGGPSSVTTLKDARICFYGQKVKNFLSVANNTQLADALRQLPPDAAFRIYNFAGNPIMAKLVDCIHDTKGIDIGSHFDVVFDLSGQKMHDVVPGAFIALKGGAYCCDLEGRAITSSDLAQRLRNPQQRMTYVLAATKELADELLTSIR